MSLIGVALRPGGRTDALDHVSPPPTSVWRSLLAHTEARIGLMIGLLLLTLMLAGPLVTTDPNAVDYANQLRPPSADHLLGTDRAGRDLLARTVAGAQTSLGAALLVMVIATAVGLAVGVIAGTAGGVIDAVLSRVTDVLLGLPGLVLTLAIVGLLGPGFLNLVLAMALTSWAGLAKLARSYSRGSAGRPDVIAARMAGAGKIRIALGHVLPGTATQVLIAATLGLGEIVLALGGLSFLGLGAQPPTAEWGNMLSAARDTMSYAPHQMIGPGLGLVLTVLAATLVSDALRDVTDPGRRT